MRTENHHSGTKAPSQQFLTAYGNIFPAILNTLKEPLFLFDDKFKMAWHNKACNELYQYVSGKQLDSDFDFNELLIVIKNPLIPFGFFSTINIVATS